MPEDLNYVVFDLNSRIRTLESKHQLFGEHLLVINRNMIEEYKKTLEEFKRTQDEISNMKKDILEIKEVLRKFAKEFNFFAKKEDLMVLEKYINLWNPMEFVTTEELQKTLKKEGGKTAIRKSKKTKKRG